MNDTEIPTQSIDSLRNFLSNFRNQEHDFHTGIDSVEVQNYKCFKEKIRVDFSNLTLFFGRNSSGKSSISSALEDFKNGNLSVNQKFHKENRTTFTLDFTTSFGIDDVPAPLIFTSVIQYINEQTDLLAGHWPISITKSYNGTDLTSMSFKVFGQPLCTLEIHNLFESFSLNLANPFFQHEALIACRDNENANIEDLFRYKVDNLVKELTPLLATEYSLFSENQLITNTELYKKSDSGFRQGVTASENEIWFKIDTAGFVPDSDKDFKFLELIGDAGLLEDFQNVKSHMYLPPGANEQINPVFLLTQYVLPDLASLAYKACGDASANKPGPLRARNTDTREWKHLRKNPDQSVPGYNRNLIGTLNLLLTSKLDINCYVSVNRESQGPNSIEIKTLQNGASVTLSDVGVGVSQIGPVIIATLTNEIDGLLFIEQPELHLHPAAQAGLGDFFLASAFPQTFDQHSTDNVVGIRSAEATTNYQKSKEIRAARINELLEDFDLKTAATIETLNQAILDSINEPNWSKKLILETHSEILMLRILRRIQEINTDKAEFDPEQISVYVFDDSKSFTTVNRIPITEDGDFAFDWPSGFFDEREDELVL